MLKSTACSAINSCSGSAELVGSVFLLIAILAVVFTPLLFALRFVYFMTQQAKLQDVPPSLPCVQRRAYPMYQSTHEPTISHASSYSEYRKAA